MRLPAKEKQMKLYAMTDVGRKREVNQDYVYVTDQPVGPFPNFLAVADGMGGHKAGDFASKYTVNVLLEELKGTPLDKPEEILRNIVGIANRKLIEVAATDVKLEGMGTTLVAATIVGNTLYFANVGDSRLYVVDKQLRQITRDHSLVDEMVRMGEINADEARVHPDKNIITRAVGAADHVEADFFEVELCEDDRILLCTDGLTNMVRDEEICDTIRQNDNIETAASQLVAMANANGGRDNITVMIIKPF